MEHTQSTTTEHQKGKHLTLEDRLIIQIRLKDHKSITSIANEIGCSRGTIYNEKRRGTVRLYNGTVERYKAVEGQRIYEEHRQNCRKPMENLEKSDFLAYVTKHVKEDNWSLDACAGRALLNGGFTREQTVCTGTLYNYVDLGLLGGIKNIDLPQKVSRNTKIHRCRENKRVLGRSIEERPEEINAREEFGHWECDLVIGSKSGEDKVLFTFLERKSREYWMIPLPGKAPEFVMQAMKDIKAEYGDHFSDVFKSITTDNGTEFSQLSELESLSKKLVYFAHPYTSCEKGSIERFNGLIRRFIPKGRRIDSYSAEQIGEIMDWTNTLPRKILKYHTPDELFDEELDKIYAAAA